MQTTRLAIVYGRATPLKWQVDCLRSLVASAGVRPVLEVFNNESPRPSPTSLLGRASEMNHYIWQAYRRSLQHATPALQACAAPSAFREPTPSLQVIPSVSGTLCLSPNDRRRLREANPDLLVNLSDYDVSALVHEGVLNRIWEYRYGNELLKDAPHAYLTAVLQGHRILPLSLCEATINGLSVLESGALPLRHSPAADISRLYLAPAAWLKKAYLRGTDKQVVNVADRRSPTGAQTPGFFAVLAFAAVLILRRILSAAVTAFLTEQWAVAAVDRPVHELVQLGLPRRVRWLWPAPSRFVADPFGFSANGELRVLVEDCRYAVGSAEIAAYAYSAGRWRHLGIPFRFARHASYPYVFTHEGAVYCVPFVLGEAHFSIFRYDKREDVWREAGVMSTDFPITDPTLVKYGERWWLFGGGDDGSLNSSLYLWHSDSPFGRWIPHRQNPVKTDVRSARPAGVPFICHGQLYRPSQDCSATYGGGIAINRVTHLTPDEYAEQTVAYLRAPPCWPFTLGLHTICGVGSLTLIDAKRRILSPVQVARRTVKAVLKSWPRTVQTARR